MTRRVVQWSATNYDLEELQVIQVFEEGISKQDVKREVHELVRLFGNFNGGYIGGTSHTVMPETPLDNIITMYEAFLEYQPGQKSITENTFSIKTNK